MNEIRRTTLKLIAGAAALATIPLPALAQEQEPMPHALLVKYATKGDPRLELAKDKLWDIGWKLRTAPITPATQHLAETMLHDAFYNKSINDPLTPSLQSGVWLKNVADTCIEDDMLKLKVQLFTLDMASVDADNHKFYMQLNMHEMECWLVPFDKRLVPVTVGAKPVYCAFTPEEA